MQIKYNNKDRLIEVAYVECSFCGFVSEDLTDWACLSNEQDGHWYYVCPNCQKNDTGD